MLGNEKSMNNFLTPKHARPSKNTSCKVPPGPKHEVSLGANKNLDELDSKQKIEDFVSKELDNFLQIQEKIKSLESISVEDQTKEHVDDLSWLRNEFQKKKSMYLGFERPLKGQQNMELQESEHCSTFDKTGSLINKTADNTKDREERAPMKENPIQKPKLVLKECSLCAMKFLNDTSLLMHKKA